MVYLGKAAGIIAGEKVSNVAIKTLSEDSPEAEKSFMKEADVMKLIDGPHHIVRLLGVVTASKPFYMVHSSTYKILGHIFNQKSILLWIICTEFKANTLRCT